LTFFLQLGPEASFNSRLAVELTTTLRAIVSSNIQRSAEQLQQLDAK
jgi:hypothetical protein